MKWLRNALNRLRGRYDTLGELTSLRLRARYRGMGVKIGLYSYGCFDLMRVPPGVTVGRYCSFAPSAQIYLRNHGINFIGLTAYLYNETLGVVPETTLPPAKLVVGDDVWLGHNCIILPQVGEIGRGAVIAAGAVVTKPVPAYAVVAGNPARVVRMRFAPEVIDAIEATRWWDLDVGELARLVREQADMVFNPIHFFSAHVATALDASANDIPECASGAKKSR